MEVKGPETLYKILRLSLAIEQVVVSIIDNAGSNSYNLNPVEVKVGETVTWVNDDSNNIHCDLERWHF